ncbi:extracellular solute-binding protein [Paenibacillus sp. D51F]
MSKAVLVIMLLVLCCTACRSSDAASPAENAESTVHYDSRLGKYSPPVALTTVGAINPDVSFINGDSLEDNVHTRWALERLGIRLQYQWSIPDTANAYVNKLRLGLAQGTLPDIVAVRDKDFIQEAIDSGKFMEVGELFDRLASPVWKNAMREDPSVWDFTERDRKNYAIPILDYDYASDPVLWIRQDWLDRLKLAAPTTLDELEKVMDAFRNRDPDGNGLSDTYGLSISFANGSSTWMGDSSWLFGAYGAVPKQWNAGSGGLLEYGSVSKGAQDALRMMKDWIQKGYLSGDSQWHDEERAAEAFVQGKAGMIAGPYWMSGWPLIDLIKLNPAADIKAIPLPAGPGGRVLRRGTLPINGAVLIHKNMKNPEIFFTYQNYLFDHYAVPSGDLANGLGEGYDWIKMNGVPTKDPIFLPHGGVRVASYTLTFDGARIPSSFTQAVSDPVVPVLLSQQGSSVKEAFTGPLTPTMRTKWELLQKLEQKTFENILYGSGSPSEHDSFVRLWYEYGGEQITHEVNEWYREKQQTGRGSS